MEFIIEVFKQYDIDWAVVLGIWLIAEQFIAGSNIKSNSSYQLLTNLLKALASKGTKTILPVLLLAALALVGCATTPTPQIVPGFATDPVVPPVTNDLDSDVQGAENFLNRMLVPLTLDAQAAVEWCNSEQGPTDPAEKLLCPICALEVLYAIDGMVEDLTALRSTLDLVKGNIDGNVMLITTATKVRFGGPGPISDVRAIKDRIVKRSINVRNACTNILPKKQLFDLASFAVGFVK